MQIYDLHRSVFANKLLRHERNKMYNALQLKKEFNKMEHGTSRMSAIKEAIRLADENKDYAYSVGFRLDLCDESCFYGDSMDMLVVFPQVLKLIDEHPDLPSTYDKPYFVNALDYVVFVYKWVIGTCDRYYQIPLKDCEKFFEDFKKRTTAFGYNLKPYYSNMYDFYRMFDENYADNCFKNYLKLPLDGNGDCEACGRNKEIAYYLRKGNLKKAEMLSKDIEDFTLTCDGGYEAWLRMKSEYLDYYMEKQDFDNAMKYINQIKRKLMRTDKSEYDYWEKFLYCYTYTDIGKALKLYKTYWKKWQDERCPSDKFEAYMFIAVFFKELEKQRKRSKIKLELDKSFPLYNDDGEYVITKLRDFYYNSAKDIALKFDKRNGTDYFMNRLNEKYS